MPLPRVVARFNRRVTNRLLTPLATHLPSFGVIMHRGRRTGRLYRTPVNVFPRPGGYVVALTYGRGDWVQNVIAAGDCILETRGRFLRLKEPHLIRDEQRRIVPGSLRIVGRFGGVAEFLDLTSDEPIAGDATPRGSG